MNFAEEIKDRRRVLQVPQDQAAVEVDRTQTWLSRVERGAVPIDGEMFNRLILAINRIAARNLAIEKAKRQATAQVVEQFENLKMDPLGN
jgi:predicted transcriptional regulator